MNSRLKVKVTEAFTDEKSKKHSCARLLRLVTIALVCSEKLTFCAPRPI